MDVRQLMSGINAYATKQPAPFTSLKDISAREAEEKTNQVFLATLDNCREVLKKRTSVQAELENFFQSKNITTQEELLDFYQDDIDEVAAYYITRKTTIKIKRSEVFDWLISNADSLSKDSIAKLANDIRNTQITVTVGERMFHLHRLNAALCSCFFRENSEDCELENLSVDHFESVGNWIQNQQIPKLEDLDEEEFHQFQELLDFLGVDDGLMSEVVQENIRRYNLKFNGNALKLNENCKFHSYFSQTIKAVEVRGAGLLPLLKDWKLTHLTIYPEENFDCALLRGFQCKIEFMGAFPKGAAGATANLLNFVVQEDSDWAALPDQNHLERVVVENVPMDAQRLSCLKGLKSIHLKFAQLGGPQVIQLCRQNPGLQSLYAPQSSCGKAGFSALAALQNLKELHIGSEGLDFQYRVALPRKGNFKSFNTIAGFKMLERLTLVKGSLAVEDLTGIYALPNLKELDISKCKVLDGPFLFKLLQSGKLTTIKIPCVGGNRANLEYRLQRNVNSDTVITIVD